MDTPINFAGGGLKYNTSKNQLSVGYLDTRYINEAGGDQMLADLNIGNHKVINVSNDGINYTTLYTSSTAITSTVETHLVNASLIGYNRFRIFAFTSISGATNPGISDFQVNVLNSLYLRTDGSNSMLSSINMNI